VIDISASDISALAKELHRIDIEFIVVGGSAMERTYPVGTGDIDVIVALKDYEQVIEKLRDNSRFQKVDYGETITGSEFRVGTRRITVEFLNPILYSGAREPDEFIDYVRRHRSKVEDNIVFADPEVVWYMRLATDYYTAYVYKIRRDVTAGVPRDQTLGKVMGVARHFGTAEKIGSRIKETRLVLDLPGVAPSYPSRNTLAKAPTKRLRARSRARRKRR